ncbi:glycosyltransferase [Thermasporomyces composti]|jgi:cellulose synthase/poly-beta-1,6-N-acetylglucosamine synthase-like glycosyltransferase|uniref:Cellulose synthase/poly-beta-1,6-N-acetylglucosamine synthase-like glycosyltransferase n=1 Tax=Thermasporomyces composti TaxID=696763 RepID=A0A3D9VBJ7_THECX|nr:glycosyltransferase [Thermasporomyces composti]REF37560.1 cellulose synthase/poly-beta-1,6-N-acetylglucosamine synthase-like glycosyltransferase [Thermasporomyces composti]
MESLIYAGLVVISLVLSVQAGHVLYLMLYTWDQPETEQPARAPDEFVEPYLSFTAIVPARHEEAVIAATIERIVRSNYPSSLLQVLVVCSADDTGTIQEAADKIDELRAEGYYNAELVIFDDQPINKPHGLNHALRYAEGDVVTIFDAEDEMHPDILNVVNTVMCTEDVNVVQAGVQLMNYNSNWYSTFNVLEYFFWFKSRLHHHARYGSTPLGGNTCFFSRELLLSVNGWDENNLTEDAEIGLRISALGERIRVVYDDRYVTKEETPPTLGSFIRQRTRWNQGFMQTLRKGVWRQMPTRHQRFLACYTLAFPYVQAIVGLYTPAALIMMVALHAPVGVALFSLLPVLLLIAHLVTAIVGLREFTEAHGLTYSSGTVIKMILTWLPYQMVLAYAAVRAVRRQLAGQGNWEKTTHLGAHRAIPEGKAVSGGA